MKMLPISQQKFIALLLDLLQATHTVKENEIKVANKSETQVLYQINDILQKHWLRPIDKERWSLKDNTLLIHERHKILPILTKLQFIDEIAASKKQYDCALIHGARIDVFKLRVHTLGKVWQQGIRFDKIFLLNGGLETDVDKVYALVAQEWPKELKHIEPINVKANAVLPLGNKPRYNTRDTLQAWLMRKTNDRHLLAISNQPYVYYQHSVAMNVLGNGYDIDTVGRADNHVVIAAALDSVARYVYEYLGQS